MTIEKWVDLSSLPKKKNAGREVVDWELVNNHEVPFLYKREKGTLLVNYSHKEKKRVFVKVGFNKREALLRSDNLAQCKIGAVVKGKVEKPEPDYQTYKTGNRVHVHEGNWLYSEKHLLKYLNEPDEAKNYTKSSNRKIDCVCPNCLREKKVSVNSLSSRGFRCSYCSTSTSYPEKLISSLLEMNNIEFEPEKKFEELGDYRYDFYIHKHNLIIETHGEQHYNPRFGIKSFNKTQESDLLKKQFCESNNITYIEIDCRKSEPKFILSNINKFIILKKLLTNQKFDILCDLIQERSTHKNIKDMLSDKKTGMSYVGIGEKYGYHKDTARNIIKRYLA